MADRDSKGRFIKSHTPLYFGKKHTDETKLKMSISAIGKKHTQKTKNKISKWGLTNKDIKRRAGIKGNKAASRGKETDIEKILYNYLKGLNIEFQKQYSVNKRFIVDAYIPSLNLIIEADGNYWHSLDRVVKKDKAENAYLKKCGYKLLRIPGNEILSGEFKNKLGV